jgi:hypothetical protein
MPHVICIVSNISGSQTNSASDFPILADAIRINSAYVKAGMKRSEETRAPKTRDTRTPRTVNGGAKYL